MTQKPQIEKFLENPLYHGNETFLVQADTPENSKNKFMTTQQPRCEAVSINCQQLIRRTWPWMF